MTTSTNSAPAFEEAMQLCHRGEWQPALEIATALVTAQPGNAAALFLAGSCMQRLCQFQPAALMFAGSLLLKPQPVSAFRLGECQAATSEFAGARAAFEACIELCLNGNASSNLHGAAARALDLLSRH